MKATAKKTRHSKKTAGARRGQRATRMSRAAKRKRPVRTPRARAAQKRVVLPKPVIEDLDDFILPVED
jgi:hypothetical protein